MRGLKRGTTTTAITALILGSYIPSAFGEADGSAEFYSQSGQQGWGVQLVCTTMNTQAIDRVLYTFLTVSCGSFSLDWGDANLKAFESDFDQISIQSGYVGPWETWESFSANGQHSLTGSYVGTEDSVDTSEDSCTLIPFFGCWG